MFVFKISTPIKTTLTLKWRSVYIHIDKTLRADNTFIYRVHGSAHHHKMTPGNVKYMLVSNYSTLLWKNTHQNTTKQLLKLHSPGQKLSTPKDACPLHASNAYFWCVLQCAKMIARYPSLATKTKRCINSKFNNLKSRKRNVVRHIQFEPFLIHFGRSEETLTEFEGISKGPTSIQITYCVCRQAPVALGIRVEQLSYPPGN